MAFWILGRRRGRFAKAGRRQGCRGPLGDGEHQVCIVMLHLMFDFVGVATLPLETPLRDHKLDSLPSP